MYQKRAGDERAAEPSVKLRMIFSGIQVELALDKFCNEKDNYLKIKIV
jgi:hypothetical protein